MRSRQAGSFRFKCAVLKNTHGCALWGVGGCLNIVSGMGRAAHARASQAHAATGIHAVEVEEGGDDGSEPTRGTARLNTPSAGNTARVHEEAAQLDLAALLVAGRLGREPGARRSRGWVAGGLLANTHAHG